MRFAIVAVLVLILGLSQLFAAGDDPKAEATKHIEGARAEVDANHPLRAADHLQQALGALQDPARRELERFLPALGEGWKVESPSETVGDMYYAIQVVRTYRKRVGGSAVRVLIHSSRRLAALHKEMYNLVELQEFQDMERSAETLSVDGWEGYRQTPEDGPTTTVAYRSPLVVLAEGNDPDLVLAVWKKLDFEGLRKLTAQ